MSDAYERIVWRGVTLNRRTVAMMLNLEKRIGRTVDAVPQGSYHTSTTQSAGTHDGGGAIDIYDHDLDEIEHAGRMEGFAAYHRLYLPGEWDAHCHMIAIGDAQMSSSALQQVKDYYNGIDGLSGHDTRDPHPWRPSPIPVFKYERVSDFETGEVYVHKLKHGVKDSDSVRRLQYRLKHATEARMPHLIVTGDYGHATVEAVKHWQHKVADSGPNNGSFITDYQAKRLFGGGYSIKD